MPGCAEVLVKPDEAMVSISCGGGGYGPPEARDPALVLRDVREGWVSRARAESVYRVAVTDALEIDAARTTDLRRA